MKRGRPWTRGLDETDNRHGAARSPSNPRMFGLGRYHHSDAQSHIAAVGRNTWIATGAAVIFVATLIAVALISIGQQQHRAERNQRENSDRKANFQKFHGTLSDSRLLEQSALLEAENPKQASEYLSRWRLSTQRAESQLKRLRESFDPSSHVYGQLTTLLAELRDYEKLTDTVLAVLVDEHDLDPDRVRLALNTINPAVNDLTATVDSIVADLELLERASAEDLRQGTNVARRIVSAVGIVLMVLFIGWSRLMGRRTKDAVDSLVALGFRDPLTGLLNTNGLQYCFDREVAIGNSRTRGVLYVDLDHFRVVNDTLGHDYGDRLLRRVSQLIEDALRPEDFLARLGGDEFGIVMSRASRYEIERSAALLLDKLRSHPLDVDGETHRITATIGVSHIGPGTDNFRDALSAADAALHVAKKTGRDQVHVLDSGVERSPDIRDTMTQAGRIHRIVENGHLKLAAQAIIDATSKVVRCELLLRATDPDTNETLSPAAIIPAAEEFGLISTIDRWVVSAAMLAADDGLLDQYPVICANLSAMSVTNGSFESFLFDKLSARPELATRLCFEITETAAVVSHERLRDFMSKIRSTGASFALDDCGTGYASFGALRELDFDCLKIDAQFVQGMVTATTDAEIVRSMVRIAKTLGISTVAEGVETREQLDRVTSMGITYAQGYFIHRPEVLVGESVWREASRLVTVVPDGQRHIGPEFVYIDRELVVQSAR